MHRTYQDICNIKSFDERLKYLMLEGIVGDATFAGKRYFNQQLYTSSQWKTVKRYIIIRDHGNDLACDGYPICGSVYVHHINPITIEDILNRSAKIFDPNNLICTSFDTHQKIHYSKSDASPKIVLERTKNDTNLW